MLTQKHNQKTIAHITELKSYISQQHAVLAGVIAKSHTDSLSEDDKKTLTRLKDLVNKDDLESLDSQYHSLCTSACEQHHDYTDHLYKNINHICTDLATYSTTSLKNLTSDEKAEFIDSYIFSDFLVIGLTALTNHAEHAHKIFFSTSMIIDLYGSMISIFLSLFLLRCYSKIVSKTHQRRTLLNNITTLHALERSLKFNKNDLSHFLKDINQKTQPTAIQSTTLETLSKPF